MAAPGPPANDHNNDARRELELQEERNAVNKKRESTWQYVSKQQLEDTDPSVLDGLDKAKAALWRRQFLTLLQKAGMNLKIPQWGIAVGALLCHRYFARKSMKRNDRYVIAAACLHLAAKMEECPKPIREVVRECKRVQMAGKPPTEQKKAMEPDEIERSKEEVLVAERSVLYTLGFDLNANHPYRFLVHHLTNLNLLQQHTQGSGSPYQYLMQNTWNFVNDSFRTQLCLQYRPEKLAVGALYLANRLNIHLHGPQGDIAKRIQEVAPGADFCTYFGISIKDAEDISHQILSLYEELKMKPLAAQSLLPGDNLHPANSAQHHPSSQPAAAHTTTPVPAAPVSTAVR